MIPRPSPNHGPRIGARPVQLIVLHADAGMSDEGTLSWLATPRSGVSYHVLIGRTGTAYRVVDDARTAWHAGVSKHPACQNPKSVNSESLGLAFANRHDGEERLTDAQRLTARLVIAEWRLRYGPLPVVTHAMVAPGRKTDPDGIPNFRLEDFA